MRSLYNETLELLRENSGRWRQVARGSGVTYDWILKLMGGHINDPGIKKIEAVYLYLMNDHRTNILKDQSRGKHATGNKTDKTGAARVRGEKSAGVAR